MAKDINIQYVEVKAISNIEVDGKQYPINQHNLDVVRKYNETGDEDCLDKLSEYSIQF